MTNGTVENKPDVKSAALASGGGAQASVSVGGVKKRAAGAALAVAVLVCAFMLPGTQQLPELTLRTMGFAAAFLVLLIAESIPLSVTCWLALAAMPLLHLTPNFGAALVGYANPVVFFILASFGIAEAFSAGYLPSRILVFLMKRFGRSVRMTMLTLMMACALLSSIVSNVPTCALLVAIGMNFLELFQNSEDKRRAGRALLIAIPVASMIGGIMTPAGSSINLLAIQLLEEATGQTVT
ncbi:MAG: anion permease, partial [Clostridiales Family XIII bacterium]|nr:anion permease [Clostridiales Family XIII bacterium]